jgi:hypothetical protein
VQIIDYKKKDYYDYVLYTLNDTDKFLTYDRKDPTILSDQNIIDMCVYDSIYGLREKYHFLLEVGFIQYLFSVENVYYDEELKKKCGAINFKKIYSDGKHYFEKEISFIKRFDFCFKADWWRIRKNDERYEKLSNFDFNKIIYEGRQEDIIPNPILKETKIPSFIEAKDIYINLLNYLSAQKNDKDYSTDLTDIDKAENHGFDKKTSFRNPIKISQL